MNSHRRLARLWLIVLSLSIAPGCLMLAGRHWDETRQEVIGPINSAFHRHLPRDIKAKDLDAIVGYYSTDTGSGLGWSDTEELTDDFAERRIRWSGPPTAEPIRQRYEHLLSLFDTIERAEIRIDRVHWDDPDPRGFPADIHLLVRGSAPGGELRYLDQWNRAWIGRHGSEWLIGGEDVVSRELVAAAEPRFEVATEAAGIQDVHDTDGSPSFRLLGDIGVSSGVAVADVDCDGYEDIALLSSSRVALYRNRADGSFTDATAETGLDAHLDNAATGLVFFDADNDGDPDLWICGVRGDRLYRNQGCGRFTDVTEAAGIRPQRWASMPIVADYDRDGFLDVYIVRMGDHENTAPTPNWQARNGVPDTLYHNQGDGTFRDVTAEAGIDERGWGLAGAWGDYDNDGDPDVYVGNEFGLNSLWRNNGDGTFTNVAADAGVLDRGAAMGVAWADVDGDGNLDLFVANMYANSRWALFHPEFPPPVPWYMTWAPRRRVDAITNELTRGSTLLRNNGDGTFTDISEAAGVRDTQWAWGVEFLDYDNDGRLDIYVANGFITGPLLDDV